jgi:hypothetical protein
MVVGTKYWPQNREEKCLGKSGKMGVSEDIASCRRGDRVPWSWLSNESPRKSE